MKQGATDKHFIADEGKVFQRVNNGFEDLKKPIVLGSTLILGKIIVDANGDLLPEPIDDKIDYYIEIDKPVEEEKDHKHRS